MIIINLNGIRSLSTLFFFTSVQIIHNFFPLHYPHLHLLEKTVYCCHRHVLSQFVILGKSKVSKTQCPSKVSETETLYKQCYYILFLTGFYFLSRQNRVKHCLERFELSYQMLCHFHYYNVGFSILEGLEVNVSTLAHDLVLFYDICCDCCTQA